MRGSIPLSGAKRFTFGRSNNLIKQLQNLYSWNQFYQERKMRPQMRKAQAQISTKKREINELKLLKRGKKQ